MIVAKLQIKYELEFEVLYDKSFIDNANILAASDEISSFVDFSRYNR